MESLNSLLCALGQGLFGGVKGTAYLAPSRVWGAWWVLATALAHADPTVSGSLVTTVLEVRSFQWFWRKTRPRGTETSVGSEDAHPRPRGGGRHQGGRAVGERAGLRRGRGGADQRSSN